MKKNVKNNEITNVPCPICHKSVEWSENSPYRPFCSKRCQLIDLGEWANEEKSIPSDTADFAIDSAVGGGEDWVKH
ncbi:DNA gyrase inhibitor [Chelonobacter oris]|uniref:DNA gyrase inhibitor YacG n=1 Tax=Chelonobacter oris TaxID=505317 RepID=A0A0A3AQ17_9PAST|nr:DNA gyrase inhibitor YacG [Chelonobacter oris]KGQ69862.1 DNA gyrase inhibitor [Chelonobacter oris]MDH2999217.1 DNA gyrase inhibitor [Chelonobacter oris]